MPVPTLYAAVMNDVPATLDKLWMLLVRDTRIFVPTGGAHLSPASLLAWLADYRFRLDVILLDTEFVDDDGLTLAGLIARVKAIRPNIHVMSLTEACDLSTVRASLDTDASGILFHQDLQYGISSALTYVSNETFLYSPSLAQPISQSYSHRIKRQLRRLPRWEIYPKMPASLQRTSDLVFLRGLTHVVAAQLAGIAPSAIPPQKCKAKRYMREALEAGYYDFSAPAGAGMPDIDAKDWPFAILTHLPAA